ncbi:MAG: response regulator transcription factor [Clostridia bacterium]|nr:response regulator transcription factor [Clostridia bacterium]MBQ9481682.1 response regulator transcription factor [Clostridia bacterium]
MFNVLIVEDDQKLNQLIKTTLVKNGYNVYTAKDGAEGIETFDNNYIDLVVSDIMMPNADGYELADGVRKRNANIPILFVSAKDKYEDKQKGFQLGIDDYMVKPIDLNELLLRVSALLRRAQIANERKLTVGSTVLDYDTMTVTREGSEIVLPQKEFNILFKLLSFPNKIFTRTQLMDEFWGLYSESLERTVDVHITRLRDKFKNNTDFEIVTVRGLGYKAVKRV